MIRSDYVEMVRSRVDEREITCTDQHILECLKYLTILSLTTGRRIAVTPEVDEVWHELIVQTSSYRELCEGLPGRRFINHQSIGPSDYAERVGRDEFVDEFLRWIPDYVHHFGRFTKERAQHWTVVRFLQDSVGLSLDEINNAGESADPHVFIDPRSPWTRLADDDLHAITIDP